MWFLRCEPSASAAASQRADGIGRCGETLLDRPRTKPAQKILSDTFSIGWRVAYLSYYNVRARLI